jgi:hypothetical protein
LEEQIAVDWHTYAKDVEAELAQLRRDFTPLEAGTMQIVERVGGGEWKDVTQETVDRNKRVIATYEAILEDVRENRLGNG